MAQTKIKKPSTLPNGDKPPFDAREFMADAEAAYPPFPFIGLDGKNYELPHAQMMPGGAAMKILEAPDEDQIELVGALLDGIAPEAWAAIQVMPGPVMHATVQAWYDTLGIDDDDEDDDSAEGGDQGKAD